MTPNQANYHVNELFRSSLAGRTDKITDVLANPKVGLNPHSLETALFSCESMSQLGGENFDNSSYPHK